MYWRVWKGKGKHVQVVGPFESKYEAEEKCVIGYRPFPGQDCVVSVVVIKAEDRLAAIKASRYVEIRV